jgi:hypothetical protein
MKKIFCACFCFSLLLNASSQEKIFTYAAISIPDSLKKEVNAVIRVDESVLDIQSPSKYSFKVHKVVTVLNSEANNHFNHVFSFDKFNKIENIEISLYNKLGLLLKKYNKKDFNIQSAYDGVSLVTDDKLMHLSTPIPEYPCTVEVKYQKNATGYIELPDRQIGTAAHATELFRYTVKVPADIDIRYRPVNMQIAPEIETENKTKIYTWEAKNIRVDGKENNGYETGDVSPFIEVAPNLFEYDGYKGAFKGWKEFGKWCYDLFEDKKPFTDQRIAERKSLAENRHDVPGKVDTLYKYLQKTMRYVSIQLGIGGFKPFAVKFVDEKKYGDCKALTNYMRSMLAVAGIKSYPALINAGYNKFPADPGFPADPFNHVILCVPNGTDTIWLECTSNSSSYINKTGFLGSFTENKNALLLTEEGGVLVKTPSSKPENNQIISHTEVFLQEDGGSKTRSRLYATGDLSHLFQYLKPQDRDKQKELIIKSLEYKQPDELSFINVTDSADGFVTTLDAVYDKLYEFKAGNKYFFPQTLYKINQETLVNNKERKTPYIFEAPYQKRDTTIFYLPKGFGMDKVPEKKEISDEFLSYQRSVFYNKENKTLQVITALTLKKNIIPARSFAKLADSFAAINKEDAAKLIMVAEPINNATVFN